MGFLSALVLGKHPKIIWIIDSFAFVTMMNDVALLQRSPKFIPRNPTGNQLVRTDKSTVTLLINISSRHKKFIHR